jgi:hypothetical protein
LFLAGSTLDDFEEELLKLQQKPQKKKRGSSGN